MKISTFLISLLLVTLVVGVFGTFYVGISTTYPVLGAYNNSTLSGYNQYETIRTQLEAINRSIDRQVQSSGTLDVGNIISQGYQTTKLTIGSFGLFGSILDAGFNSIAGFTNFSLFKTVLYAIALVSFIFILVGVLVGRSDV